MSQQNGMHCCRTVEPEGMIQARMQQFHDIYPAQTALRQGTLFPELDKPFAYAPVPTGCAEPTHLQEEAFAAWEIRLYLHTHPDDENALGLFQRLCEKSQYTNYASAMMEETQCSGWAWADDPWPWETCANERKA